MSQGVFTEIYKTAHWSNLDDPASEDTLAIRISLPHLLRRFHIASILDIGCHVLGWMRTVNLQNIHYTGVDIVPDIIEKCRNRFPELSFLRADAGHDSLPPADLIICRDFFVHLSHREAMQVVDNIQHLGGLLLATTFPGAGNEECETGNWRPLDLTRAPYNFPEPLELILEDRLPDMKKCLGLFRLWTNQ